MANGNGLLADRTPIRVADYGQLTNPSVIFQTPDDLAAGAYKPEVRRRFGQIRLGTGTLETILVVV